MSFVWGERYHHKTPLSRAPGVQRERRAPSHANSLRVALDAMTCRLLTPMAELQDHAQHVVWQVDGAVGRCHVPGIWARWTARRGAIHRRLPRLWRASPMSQLRSAWAGVALERTIDSLGEKVKRHSNPASFATPACGRCAVSPGRPQVDQTRSPRTPAAHRTALVRRS